MQGELPKALLSTFKNTKFPAIDDKIKQLLADQEEALVAHESAQTRIASIQERTESLARHMQSKNELSQKNGT